MYLRSINIATETSINIATSLFILWFICQLWNIQISAQYANCEETNAFMVILSFFWGIYLDILAKASNFWLTFWTLFKWWFSNVNLWSISTPNSSSYLLLLSRFPPTLKSGSHPPKEILFVCFNNSLSKMMKNAFYFILKALFILKILNFLSWLFGHVEKTAWLER